MFGNNEEFNRNEVVSVIHDPLSAWQLPMPYVFVSADGDAQGKGDYRGIGVVNTPLDTIPLFTITSYGLITYNDLLDTRITRSTSKELPKQRSLSTYPITSGKINAETITWSTQEVVDNTSNSGTDEELTTTHPKKRSLWSWVLNGRKRA